MQHDLSQNNGFISVSLLLQIFVTGTTNTAQWPDSVNYALLEPPVGQVFRVEPLSHTGSSSIGFTMELAGCGEYLMKYVYTYYICFMGRMSISILKYIEDC